MRIIRWLDDNILFVCTLFLLAFIPLYPKIPLIDIKNTWVYIRLEDFFVVFALLIWIIQLLRGKVSLKTPITLSILIFWIVGSIATIHGVLIIFPALGTVYSNVAFLSFLRRIEYLSLFFIAYSAMRDKRNISWVIAVLITTLLLVVFYGIGQRYFGFPAFLTGNEEFAKGVPIRLSPLSRVPATFAGHYDLAAYLVLIIPILVSLLFAIRLWITRLLLLATIAAALVLLFMTVSRISFFVLPISLIVLLFLHGFTVRRKALLLLSSSILVIVVTILSLNFSKGLLDRFLGTVKEVDVLVNATTGGEIGHVKKIQSLEFENKVIFQKDFGSRDDLGIKFKSPTLATPSAKIVPFSNLPQEVVIVIPPDLPTGENLPQGTGYINLSLSPVVARVGDFFYERQDVRVATEAAYVTRFIGDFLIKRASAYDLSFTTRFQGEWPNAIKAFRRNILFGSGYSSISLAVDNNFLRILGEVGLLGFISFFAIFILAGIYIRKTLPEVTTPLVRSFILGFIAGVVGLFLNALFIDVFEASKIAYLLWLLVGVSVGTLHLYQTKHVSLYPEFKKIITSKYAIIVYICIVGVMVFSPMTRNFYVGDDFTWLRWVAECSQGASSSGQCSSVFTRIIQYFTDADGFFYRPGTKIYFLLMYSIFWLNQGVYHIVSISLHIIVTMLVFLLARKVFRDNLLSAIAAFSFLILSGFSEAVFWISSTGHLINVMFILLSLLFFIFFEENKKNIYFVASLFSFIFALLFHELGIVTPFLIVLYKFVSGEPTLNIKGVFQKIHYKLIFLPILPYLIARFFAQSHWYGGDYSYNPLMLPFNFVGNTIGYFMLALFGPTSLPLYEALRNFSKENIAFAATSAIVVVYAFTLIYRMVIRKMEKRDLRIVVFSFLFFVLSLLPFLGLGNITSRYSYLATAGFVLLFVFFLKKLYWYLQGNGRDIALASVVTILSLFYLLNVIQLQQIHSDWYEAGEKIRRFFTKIDASYASYWSEEPIEFHFVNVPIRAGHAWVFPVGLPDALWFVLRNPNVRVYQDLSIVDALNAVDNPHNEKIFEFDSRGNVTEVKKIKTTEGFIIEKNSPSHP